LGRALVLGEIEMGTFDHWHPMLPSRSLRRKPVGACLHGKNIALFRTASGQVGALDDQCPHRRMRLSLGTVIGEKLQCRYHGWTFDCAGNGESPGTPKMHACASNFEACEKYDYVWVKSKESQPVFPRFDVDGWFWIGASEHAAPAPLELTLDNFCEIEHTPTTHSLFGYELSRMKEVTVRIETTDDTVTVVNHGPPKRINPLIRFLVGIKKNHVFNDTWTTHFSPVYSVYDHLWIDPHTGDEATVKWRVYIFFSPVSEMQTRITAFTFAQSKWRVPPNRGLALFRRFMRRRVSGEIALDVNVLAGLADYRPQMEGMKLSRFDKALMLNRERVDKIYRGAGRGLKLALGD
jgi:phenylpropionate dioxygenase-like ring-hydroxylating dioxygenase large terminal subunit